MARRRLTLKRIDPWSVLKFGFVANLAFLAISLLGLAIVWFFVQRLGLIDKVCTMAQDLAFENCGVDGGNLFRATFLLGLLGTVVQTGVWVFLAFLYNLIADLVGGLSFTYLDESGMVSTGRRAKGSDGEASDGTAVERHETPHPTPAAPASRGAPPPPPSGWQAANEDRMFDRGGAESGATTRVPGGSERSETGRSSPPGPEGGSSA